jgi:hypothetical protein
MKVQGAGKLIRQMKDLPDATRKNIAKALDKSGQEGVRVAKALAPVRLGGLVGSITYRLEDQGTKMVLDAGEDTKRGKIKALTVEGGRDDGPNGKMAAQPYFKPTRLYLGKKHKARIQRAIRAAAKEVTNG